MNQIQKLERSNDFLGQIARENAKRERQLSDQFEIAIKALNEIRGGAPRHRATEAMEEILEYRIVHVVPEGMKNNA